MIMNDTDNNRDVEEAWAVEPPKKAAGKKRKALRIALIVAALGAAAVAAVQYGGEMIRRRLSLEIKGIWGNPVHEDGKPVYDDGVGRLSGDVVEGRIPGCGDGGEY